MDVSGPATTADTITVLRTLGPLLTKVWDGEEIKDYDEAKNFKVVVRKVADIHELSEYLDKLEREPQCCIIRGALPGDAESATPVMRRNAVFEERAHHWMLVDIDRYTPMLADPVDEPEAAIDEFISQLPPEFHSASYHWQLSSSAGSAKNRGLLKAHVWFWLDSAYTGPQLDAWARVKSVPLDKSVLRRVQVHYTAAPVFKNGAVDPVPVRSGFAQRSIDAVPLHIDPAVMQLAREHDDSGEDLDLVDPKEKPGLIGAFCREFTMDEVLERWLSEEFEKVTDRRLTWINGGGSPEGAFITPCGEYIVNTHNTDPLDNRAANKWDLVRHYTFGHLDEGLDPLFKLSVRDLPSQDAMVELAKTLGLTVERDLTPVSKLDGLKQQIHNAPDFETLRDTVCAAIALDGDLDPMTRELLAQSVKEKCMDLGARLPIAMCRDLVRPSTRAAGTPHWLEGWVYVTDDDKFFNVNTKQWVSMQGFNAMFNRQTPGDDPNAARTALTEWNLPTVQRTAYVPWLGQLFDMNDVPCANTYRPESVPVVVPHEGSEAVRLVQQHVSTLLGESAHSFTQWMAHNVQYPGKKIRWAYIIKGIPGDGKSLLGTVMAQVMGQENTTIISPRVLGTDFNGWAEGHCVGICEEMREVGHSRHDNMNAMKPNITNDTIPIHRKGKDEYNIINTTNYLIFTNYADALPLDEGDRRIAVVFSPFDTKEQLAEALGPAYFEKLHDAIEGGAGELRSWLLSVSLVGFDPNGSAPMTADKASMIAMAKSDEEQLAEEVISEGAVGVGREVISSAHLTAAMQAKGDGMFLKTTTVNRLLVRLGYTQRPGQVKWSGRACRVWVRASHRNVDNLVIRDALDATLANQCDEFL